MKLFPHIADYKLGVESDNEKMVMGWLRGIIMHVSIDNLRRAVMLSQKILRLEIYR